MLLKIQNDVFCAVSRHGGGARCQAPGYLVNFNLKIFQWSSAALCGWRTQVLFLCRNLQLQWIALSSLFTHIGNIFGMFLWTFSYSSFSFKFLWLQKMSLFLVAEIIRTMGRSDGAIVSVKQKIYNPKNDLFLFSSIRCEHLRPANNFFRHNKWRCVWFSDFLPPPTATLMRVSAIHDSLTPGYDENCPSLAVWFTRGHVPRVPALAVWWGLSGRADLFPVAAAALLLITSHILITLLTAATAAAASNTANLLPSNWFLGAF